MTFQAYGELLDAMHQEISYNLSQSELQWEEDGDSDKSVQELLEFRDSHPAAEVVKELKRQTTEELEIEFHNAHKASEMYVDFQDECITKMLNMQREQSPRIPALPDSHLSSQSSAFAKFIPNNVPIFRFTK